jgi:hypothetical protein
LSGIAAQRKKSRFRDGEIVSLFVKTGQLLYEIVLAGKVESTPIATADPSTSIRLCVRLCEETLARLGKKNSPLKVK